VTYDSFTLSLSIAVIAMILIGGLDSQAGPLIGAVVITTLPIFVPDIIGNFVGSSNASQDASNYSEVIYGALIMIFMIKAPKGLVGLIQATGRKVLSRWDGSRTSPLTNPLATNDIPVPSGTPDP
jgi:branched-chain amino acid transport system permease protein